MYYLVLVKLNGFEYHPLVWGYYPIHCPIRYSKYCSLIAVRSSRTSYRFHSLHLAKSQRSVFQKGSKQSAPHSHNSAALRSAPFCSFVHTLFAFTRELARRPLFGQSKEQCKHSQLQSLQERQKKSKGAKQLPHLTLCASACFRRWAHHCNKHSFCRSRQRSASRCKLVVKI